MRGWILVLVLSCACDRKPERKPRENVGETDLYQRSLEVKELQDSLGEIEAQIGLVKEQLSAPGSDARSAAEERMRKLEAKRAELLHKLTLTRADLERLRSDDARGR